MNGYVYAFRFGDFYKIGFSTNPASRLGQTRAKTGDKWLFVGAVPATMEQEKELHSLLAKERVRGREWYRAGKLTDAFASVLPKTITMDIAALFDENDGRERLGFAVKLATPGIRLKDKEKHGKAKETLAEWARTSVRPPKHVIDELHNFTRRRSPAPPSLSQGDAA